MPPRRYYFRSTDGSTLGPFNLNVVAEMIRADKVKAHTPVSTDGNDFRPMKSFPELATLLSVDIETDMSGPVDEGVVEAIPVYTGKFEDVSLPKLMYHFVASKVTGKLLVTNQSVKKELFLVNGKLVAATSNLKRDQLGQHLLRKKVLSEEQLAAVLEELSQRQDRLGDFLIQRKLVEPHDLVEHLREQLKEKVYEIFNWRTGKYAFYEGQEYPGSLLPMNQNPWELISEGVRQGFDLTELEELLSPYFDYVLIPKENKTLHVNQLGLMPLELKVFKTSANERTFGELLNRLGGDDRKNRTILATVYLGLELDLLTFGERYQVEPELPGELDADMDWQRAMDNSEQAPVASGSEQVVEDKGMVATPPVSRTEQKLLEKLNELGDKDYFECLGVERTATSAEISKAFMSAARTYHPDQIPPDASESVRELYSRVFAFYNEAHQKLSDDKSRQEYLEALDAGHEDSEVDVSNILEAENAFQRGEVLLNARKFREALEEFEQAVKLNPDEGEFHIYRGYTLFMANPDAESSVKNTARDMIGKGLEMRNNEVAVGFLFLGRIDKADGDDDSARKKFKKALSIDRGLVEASRELRLMDMRSGKKGLFRRK